MGASFSSNINEVIRAVLNSLFFFFFTNFTHTHTHILTKRTMGLTYVSMYVLTNGECEDSCVTHTHTHINAPKANQNKKGYVLCA